MATGSRIDDEVTPEAKSTRSRPEAQGNADAYMARSEGVKSRGTLALALRVFDDPSAMKPEETRKLAAAVMAFHRYGK